MPKNHNLPKFYLEGYSLEDIAKIFKMSHGNLWLLLKSVKVSVADIKTMEKNLKAVHDRYDKLKRGDTPIENRFNKRACRLISRIKKAKKSWGMPYIEPLQKGESIELACIPNRRSV